MSAMLGFALLDTKASYFGLPFFTQSKGEAIRICMDALADMRSTIARYPADFSLYYIGTYDTQTGTMLADHPENLGVLVQFLPTPQARLPLEQAADNQDTK